MHAAAAAASSGASQGGRGGGAQAVHVPLLPLLAPEGVEVGVGRAGPLVRHLHVEGRVGGGGGARGVGEVLGVRALVGRAVGTRLQRARGARHEVHEPPPRHELGAAGGHAVLLQVDEVVGPDRRAAEGALGQVEAAVGRDGRRVALEVVVEPQLAAYARAGGGRGEVEGGGKAVGEYDRKGGVGELVGKTRERQKWVFYFHMWTEHSRDGWLG
mmetsp:Transcript_28079/g.74088  ORF Transcript_28079/g.74088 Transcript_28079/m.74088 type:complete len:214 (-) Transcript_28079:836-1477(-)